jgi:t-SNARE complex subunit (syntaxin)
LATIEAKSAEFRTLADAFERAADEVAMKSADGSAQSCANEVSRAGLAVKGMLDALRTEIETFSLRYPDAKNSASLNMRENVYNLSVRRFRDAMNRYQREHNMFLSAVAQRQKSRLKSIDTGKVLDDATIERVVESGQVEQVIQQSLLGSSEELQDCIANIEARHQQVLSLERTMRDLLELFKDMATLVDVQQDSLNIIEKRIVTAKNYAERGAEHLKEAEKHQKCGRKGQCCLLCLVIIIVIVIIVPILTLASKTS